jgi:hypothetical protein
MICTRNGVIVALNEYGDQRMTDLYLPHGENGLWILRTTAQPFLGKDPHLIIHRVLHWFDENKDFGVLIVNSQDVTVTANGGHHIYGGA